MSALQSLVLGGGRAPGAIAAVIGLVSVVNRFSQASDTKERVALAIEGLTIVTDLTPSQADDELLAKVNRVVNTPEAVALLEASLAFWKSLTK